MPDAVRLPPLPLGEAYPPRSPLEIAVYCEDEILRGYTEYAAGEELPGANSSPGYRWGALNRQRDRLGRDDGYDHLRRAYLAARNSSESSYA